MRHRNTVALFILFLTGLCVLWWADYTDVPDRNKLAEMSGRTLPELLDTPVSDVRRIEVDRRSGTQKDRIVVERREGGRWQLVEPVDTAADPELVETLAGNLKELRKSPAAGTIKDDPARYGLTKPEAEVKVFVGGKTAPVAALDLGTSSKEFAYVRPGTGAGIEVVDSRLLSALTKPAAEWRDTALLRVPSFRVESVTVKETNPDVTITLRREDRRWRMVSPVKAPADADKAEGLVAEVSALRVPDGKTGFVADDVRDLARYGLDSPSMTIEVSPFANSGLPQRLLIGNPVPDTRDEVYAMRGDQDDVVRLSVKRLREAIPGPNALRSQTVLDVSPSRVDRLRIDERGTTFDLKRTPAGWKLLSPVEDNADTAAVLTLLNRLSELKTSEFLEPSRVVEPRLDPPRYRVRGWQAARVGSTTSVDPAAEPKEPPGFDLSLGRDDALKHSVYGRVAGDTTILALPESILTELPQNAFAFRDRTVLSLKPEQFASVTVERERSSVTVEAPPTTGARELTWKMVEPVKAAADQSAVTGLLLTLGNLRAEKWESDRVGDGRDFGLDAPWLRVKWTLQAGAASPKSTAAGPKRGVLRLGNVKAKGTALYANIEGDERVFSLNPGVVSQLRVELHDTDVLRFKPDESVRVVVAWPTRTLSLERTPGTPRSRPVWQISPGYDPTGFDVSRADGILSALAGLKTPRFLQYTGPIPDATGLKTPRVSVRVKVTGQPDEFVLRVGNGLDEKTYVATNTDDDAGPVFVLPAEIWKDVLKPPGRPDDLPEDVFTPGTAPATPGTQGRT